MTTKLKSKKAPSPLFVTVSSDGRTFGGARTRESARHWAARLQRCSDEQASGVVFSVVKYVRAESKENK